MFTFLKATYKHVCISNGTQETNPETKKFLVEADNKVVMIFNSYMDKKYPNPDSINLEQLLSWHLWSCFIRICKQLIDTTCVCKLHTV